MTNAITPRNDNSIQVPANRVGRKDMSMSDIKRGDIVKSLTGDDRLKEGWAYEVVRVLPVQYGELRYILLDWNKPYTPRIFAKRDQIELA